MSAEETKRVQATIRHVRVTTLAEQYIQELNASANAAAGLATRNKYENAKKKIMTTKRNCHVSVMAWEDSRAACNDWR